MIGWRRFLGLLQTPRVRARHSLASSPTITVAIARHLVGGQLSGQYFWIGLPDGNLDDWYNWPPEGTAHRGQVRHGADMNSYGKHNLRGYGMRLYMKILEIMPPGLLQELWFGPEFPVLGTMFRIQVYRPADLDRAIQTAKVAARAIFGDDVKFVEVAPMS
jgi:hypothetical protein